MLYCIIFALTQSFGLLFSLFKMFMSIWNFESIATFVLTMEDRYITVYALFI